MILASKTFIGSLGPKAWRHLSINVHVEAGTVAGEVSADRTWSQGPGAKKMMSLMLTKTTDSSTFDMSAAKRKDLDLSSYIANRGFIPEGLVDCESAKRTAAATMTFPLTLSYGLRRIFSAREEKKDVLNVLVLGARSESSLPSIWWKESLLSGLDVVGKSLSISLMGPGLQQQTQKQPHGSSFSHNDKSVTVRHVEGGAVVFHDHPIHMKFLLETDLFVLFNPGFGSTKQLQESWAPTLRLLLMTRKPVLATAHSAWDLKRDLARLESLTNEEDHQDLGEPIEFVIPPHANPMASAKRTYDAKEEAEAQVVVTNQFCYSFMAK